MIEGNLKNEGPFLEYLRRARDNAFADCFFYEVITLLLPHVDWTKVQVRKNAIDQKSDVYSEHLQTYTDFRSMLLCILHTKLETYGLQSASTTVFNMRNEVPAYVVMCDDVDYPKDNINETYTLISRFFAFKDIMTQILEQMISHNFPVIFDKEQEVRHYRLQRGENSEHIRITPGFMARMRADVSSDLLKEYLNLRTAAVQTIKWHEARHKQDQAKVEKALAAAEEASALSHSLQTTCNEQKQLMDTSTLLTERLKTELTSTTSRLEKSQALCAELTDAMILFAQEKRRLEAQIAALKAAVAEKKATGHDGE